MKSSNPTLTVVTVLLFGLCACSESERPRPAGSGDPAAAVPNLNPDNVPEDLRDLVPLAQRWGIGDDVVRSERVEKSSEAERSQLKAAFAPRSARITAWLDSFGQGVMPDEAAAFMYTQLAIEEMP
ncbi:MAG TPA: hypothetical protein VFZ87_04125 [Gemmatimonadales bacterium]